VICSSTFLFLSNKTNQKDTRLVNMKGEERTMDQDESQQNSQTEPVTDETNMQTDHSQTPPM
jgi:hypothetical protein